MSPPTGVYEQESTRTLVTAAHVALRSVVPVSSKRLDVPVVVTGSSKVTVIGTAVPTPTVTLLDVLVMDKTFGAVSSMVKAGAPTVVEATVAAMDVAVDTFWERLTS